MGNVANGSTRTNRILVVNMKKSDCGDSLVELLLDFVKQYVIEGFAGLIWKKPLNYTQTL